MQHIITYNDMGKSISHDENVLISEFDMLELMRAESIKVLRKCFEYEDKIYFYEKEDEHKYDGKRRYYFCNILKFYKMSARVFVYETRYTKDSRPNLVLFIPMGMTVSGKNVNIFNESIPIQFLDKDEKYITYLPEEGIQYMRKFAGVISEYIPLHPPVKVLRTEKGIWKPIIRG